MKTPLSWINIYSPLDNTLNSHSITELAHIYSTHTAEIDDIISYGIPGIIIGKVVSCEKHLDSKKLSIVQVNIGNNTIETILTGAENIKDALYVPVAPIGTRFSDDFVITERKMAGMLSRGMICSVDELGLVSERADGIMILEEYWDKDILESKIGQDFYSLTLDFPGINGEITSISLRDTVFDIDNKFITNRPDLFSIIGNSREWSTVFGIKNTINEIDSKLSITSSNPLNVHIESDDCLAYSLLRTDNISVNSSPLSLVVMMERAGLLPKNDIVDITNMIMVEYGQPMHAFDADKVTGDIIVRKAHQGEKLTTLMNQELTLTTDDLVIADETGPIALAGIIGGLNTAVTATTTSVLWEAATFDATSVRLSAQRHAIRTDASTRFEKSLDPHLPSKVFPRVIEYLRFLNKHSNIGGNFAYSNQNADKTIAIQVPKNLFSSMAGIHIDEINIKNILTSLDFRIIEDSNDFYIIQVPSYRATKDVTIAEDVVEEVLRVYGYENITPKPLSGDISIRKYNKELSVRNYIMQYFASKGWSEVYNYSFTSEQLQNSVLGEDVSSLIGIQNAYTTEFTHMRLSLAPRLILNIANNSKYNKKLRFFEIGNVYTKDFESNDTISSLLIGQNSKPYHEHKIIGGITTYYSVHQIREFLIEFFGCLSGVDIQVIQGNTNASKTESVFHPGVFGKILINTNEVAKFGKIHPTVIENFGISDDAVYFEIDFEVFKKLYFANSIEFSPISSFQPITRELNFLVRKREESGKIKNIIASSHPWINTVSVLSIFEDSEKLGADMRSIVYHFTIQSPESTITDEEAKSIQETVIHNVENAGYKLRGI